MINETNGIYVPSIAIDSRSITANAQAIRINIEATSVGKGAITSDGLEIAIYIREIAADSEEIGTNSREMPENIEEIRPNGLETTTRRLVRAVNPRFTGVSA